MHRYALALVLLLVFTVSAFAAPITTDNSLRVYDAVIHLKNADDLQTLKPLYLMITSRHGMELSIQASTEEIAYLRKAGWRVDVLGRNDQREPRAEYHTYESCLAEMQQMVVDNPTIASLQSIGDSVNDRGIWVLKLSDNVSTDEAEPALLFEFTIHGDEQIAMEVGMAFANHLLDNYGTDGQITDLIDDMEIYLVPMVNPDGVAAIRRTNGNYEDLNRNFPFWWEGWGSYVAEPETIAMVTFGLANNFMLGIDYHSGAEIINYCWDSIYHLSPDDDLEQLVSNVYDAQSGYGITNGAAWYIADGSAEDWYHGSLGTMAVIVEISNTKMPPTSQIQTYIDMNLPSMLDWSEVARRGVWGTVTDSAGDAPLEATIFVGDRLPVMSNADHGDFYRLLEEGTYSLKVWANGYGWTTVDNVVVPASGHIETNVQLTASSDNHAAVRCALNLRNDPSDNPPNHTYPMAALGGADGNAFSLGVDGWAVFDMGETTPVPCDGSTYLYIVEALADGADGYEVQVAEEWTGPWESLGSGNGNETLSLDGVSFTSIRYVRIVDDGDGGNWIATPGADIDAIEVTDVPLDDDTVDDDTVDDDTVDDDTVDDDTVDDDTVDDDTVDDDTIDDDTVDDDTTDDDVTDDDVTDDDVTDDDVTDDDVTDDDTTDDDDDIVPDDDDDTFDDDDDDDNDAGCGCQA